MTKKFNCRRVNNFLRHSKFNTANYLRFPWDIYKKMFYYCLLRRGEISGFGKIKLMRNKINDHYLITDLKIFKQKCESFHTSLDEKDQSNFIIELAKTNENPKHWCCWWHTHYNSTAFFSGEDILTIKKLSKNSELISVCISQLGEITCRYDNSENESFSLTPIIIPDIKNKEDSLLIQKIRKEIKQKVSVDKLIYKGTLYDKPKTKRKYGKPIFETNGIGQTKETIDFENYYHRSRSGREFYDTHFV